MPTKRLYLSKYVTLAEYWFGSPKQYLKGSLLLIEANI